MADDLRDMEDFERSAGPGTGRTDQADGAEGETEDLLAMPEQNAAKRVLRLWEKQEPIMKPRREGWKANRARRAGIANVIVTKDRDTKEVKVYIPPGPQLPVMNKADRLCRRITSFLFADPPVPDATPSGDDDQARDSAEFATRALRDVGSEGQLDDALHARQAFDIASTYDSGFRRYYVSPAGNGRRPIPIRANPAVMTLRDALLNPGPEPHITRYATLAGELAHEANRPDLRLQWLPKLEVEVLTGKHIRFLPATARDIWHAEGALVGVMIPLGQLRAMFPEKIGKLDAAELRQLTSERPHGHIDLLPASQRRFERAGGDRRDDDDSLVFVLTLYYKRSPRFKRGVYMIVAGKDIVLHRGPWEDPRNAENELDIPIDQFKQFDDEDEPYGKGMMQLLGPGNELRNIPIGTFLEHLDRFINRKVFYPIHSVYQPKQAQSATGTHIPINQGGQPIVEEIPDFPQAAEKFLDFVGADMDDESGLQQIGQGLNPPGVKSGLHAQQITEQVIATLSDLRQNSVRALLRGWRIQLQLIRAFYTVPQRIEWEGDDGEFKQKMWTTADLGSTKDVRLHRGSFTSLTPSAKAAVAEYLYQLQILTPEELEHVALAQVGGQLALQDNPHRLRVRRQITRWLDGPPPDWQPPEPQLDPQTQQPVPAPDPALLAIFDPRAVDDLPTVAAIRLHELGRLMSSTRFVRWPPEWQRGVVDEFQRARQAAGVQTFAEIAQAQQAAQQAAEQAQQAELEAKTQGAQADREGRVQVAEITSRGEIEEERIKAGSRIREKELDLEAGARGEPGPV